MALRTASRRLSCRPWRCVALAALAALAGCRNIDNAQVDVLERELRRQEDYIYELEDYLVEYSEKLRQARMVECQPASTGASTGATGRAKGPLLSPTLDDDRVERPTLPMNGRSKLAAPPAAGTAPPPSSSAIVPPSTAATDAAPPAGASPAVEPPAEPVEAAPESTPPESTPPEEMVAPELEIGDELGDAGPLLIPDPIDYQADVDDAGDEASLPTAAGQEPAEPGPSEPRLAAPALRAPRLSADRLKVRRIFAEAPAGEEKPGSLLVVVEAVNATDEPGDAIGAASLMIMTRDEAGGLKRLHRWDFTPQETAAAWQSSALGDGLHLELPLEGVALPEGELELWARVVDDAGAKLLTPAESPYRFEAAQLAALDQAADDAAVAAAPPRDEANAALTTAAAESQTAADPAEEPAGAAPSQWRASTVRVSADRVEGFATTAGGSAAPNGWSTKPLERAAARDAAGAAATGRPKWKRSTSAAAATATRPGWSADR